MAKKAKQVSSPPELHEGNCPSYDRFKDLPDDFPDTVRRIRAINLQQKSLEEEKRDLQVDISAYLEMCEVSKVRVDNLIAHRVVSHTAKRIDGPTLLQQGVKLAKIEAATFGGEEYSYVTVIDLKDGVKK